ncbi:hypothetical protein [Abyssisolibacter fermentans]|uniref:hypothetical protein n=1 Tax=Abyssisolibacter fermentans TaxID=1766203 RepID=UPI000836D4F9|nr:hypothetical protein [Abyssisolibacter fermentans]
MQYNSKTNWQRDDIVTEKDLNRIEQGIKDACTKLAGIQEGATNYQHPATHPATIITEDSTHKFVTDTEKTNWNNKADTSKLNEIEQGIEDVHEKMGKIRYMQNTEPTVKEEGLTWFNPETGLLYIHDGTRYVPVPPVQILQEVIDFYEDDVKIQHNSTIKNNGGIVICNQHVGSDVMQLTDNQDPVIDGKCGIKFIANKDMDGIRYYLFKTHPNMGTITLFNDNFQELKSQNIYSSGSLYYPIVAGKTYILCAVSKINKYMYLGANGTPAFPYASEYIDVISSVLDTNTTVNSYVYAFRCISPIVPASTSGTAIVEITNTEKNIKSWDLATYQNTLDGETVTIDIETSPDGSVWTTEFVDISQNFDISTIDSMKDIRFKINLSRSNIDNNPSCDYLARRFVR